MVSRNQFKCLLYVSAAIVLVVVAFLFFSSKATFHRRIPAKTAIISVVDDAGRPLNAPQVVVKTTYWYPSLIGQTKLMNFEERYVGDEAGRVALQIKRHHQVRKVEIEISGVGCLPYRTQIYDDSSWIDGPSPARRFYLLRATAPAPVQTVIWSKSGFPEEMHAKWNSVPLWISLKKKSISEKEGDILLELLDEPGSDSSAMRGKSVRLRISYPVGLLQRVAGNEVAFDLGHPQLSALGEVPQLEVGLFDKGDRPHFEESFVLSSADKTVRGALRLSFETVTRRAEQDLAVRVAMYGRVEFSPGAN